MTEKISLFINDRSGKVHIMSRNSVSYAICGAHSQGRHSLHELGNKTYDFTPRDWCSKCIEHVAMEAISGSKRHQFVLDHALNRPAKKEETVIDSVRAELSFDDEELTLKVLAGRSTGARDNFGIKAELELALSWDQLDNIRDLTENAEEVKMTVFSMKPDDV